MIEIQNDADYPVDVDRLETAVTAVLEAQNVASGVTVVIADNETITNLNRQFRQVDAPTDVLSFPAEMPDYLGDIIIAYPYALAQAQRESHNPDDSFVLLVIHGVLHLLGHDHDTTENRAAMWEVQEQMLQLVGVSPEIVPALEGYDEQDH